MKTKNKSYPSKKNIQKLKCLEHFNQFPYYKLEPNTRNKKEVLDFL